MSVPCRSPVRPCPGVSRTAPARSPGHDGAMTTDTTVHDRPHWSAAEAARRCGVGRTTIMRALADGKFPTAVKDDTGWSIPLGDLLAAGFAPNRPSPPDTPPGQGGHGGDHHPDHGHDTPADGQVAALSAKLAEAEAELVRWRERAQVAEAVANERGERVADLRTALRMLEAAPREPASPPDTIPGPLVAQPAPPGVFFPPPRHGRRSWRQWREDRRARRR